MSVVLVVVCPARCWIFARSVPEIASHVIPVARRVDGASNEASRLGPLRRPYTFTSRNGYSVHARGTTPPLRCRGAPLLLVADRTSIVEESGPDAQTVEIRGKRYPGARTEVIAVDPSFSRCFGHGFVHAHPVDPAKYVGFEGMRKLRSL